MSGGGRLMEAEAHALVVSAEGEPAEARFFRAGLVGMATEFADGVYGGVDVSDREEDIDAALLVLVVEPTADRRSLDPRLVAVSHRVEGPLKQLAVEGLRALGVRYADLEEGWFPARGCSLGRHDAGGTDDKAEPVGGLGRLLRRGNIASTTQPVNHRARARARHVG
jgi:hypothetical protein